MEFNPIALKMAKLYGVLAILSEIGFTIVTILVLIESFCKRTYSCMKFYKRKLIFLFIFFSLIKICFCMNKLPFTFSFFNS